MKLTVRITAILITLSAIVITITGGIIGTHVYRWEVLIWGASQITITWAWATARRAASRFEQTCIMLRAILKKCDTGGTMTS